MMEDANINPGSDKLEAHLGSEVIDEWTPLQKGRSQVVCSRSTINV
jgi:hypothetical protein